VSTEPTANHEKHFQNFYIRLGPSRVLEYHSSGELLEEFFTMSTHYFLFPATNFHFRLQFLQSIDELLKIMETWGFAISFTTCQSGNRSDYIHKSCLFKAPGTLTHHLFFVIGSFRY